MSSQQAPLGHNRTGVATSPDASQRMVEGTAEFMPLELPADEQQISLVRRSYARSADPIGSVPPPVEAQGIAHAIVQGLKGNHPTQFLDKLGERLAFERTGVRLYQALISKFVAHDAFAGGPELGQLEKMMMDEHEHFRMLSKVIQDLGGDPTVITPAADLAATLAKGIVEVLLDPRTTFVQCLDAIQVAELSDNECWETLVELARQNTKDGVLASFERARAEEDVHLSSVRSWIAAA